MLQEVAKSFDPESWHHNNGKLNGELNDTAKAALNSIANDKLTATHSRKRTAVDVWEVQPSQMDFDFLRADGFIMIGLLWAERTQILRLIPRVGSLTAA